MTIPALIPGTCPSEEWKEFDKYCYYLSGSYDSHDNAEHFCQIEVVKPYEAHLTSIHSPAEKQFIRDIIGNTRDIDVWIGLRKADISKKVMSYH